MNRYIYGKVQQMNFAFKKKTHSNKISSILALCSLIIVGANAGLFVGLWPVLRVVMSWGWSDICTIRWKLVMVNR